MSKYQALEKRLNNRKSKVVINDARDIKDLAEIIHNLLVNKKSTIAVHDSGERLHCPSGRARSIQDCYLVAKNYFPSITYLELHKAVVKLYPSVLTTRYCYTVGRIVHYPSRMGLSKNTVRKELGKLNIINENYGKRKISSTSK